MELGFWDFPPHLQRAIATANFIRYDEVTAQAPGLAHDRDRDPGDSLHFLFREDPGLRRDGEGPICAHL